MTEAKILNDTVIKQGYCIGCGVCASLDQSPFDMKMDEFGNIVAYAKESLESTSHKFLSLCPFSGKSKNETELANDFFQKEINEHKEIGNYIECFAGYVSTSNFRAKGSSGGIGKWIGYKLLEENKIDYLIQLKGNKTDDPTKPLFEYALFSKKEDVLEGSRSSYYPVTLNKILKYIKHNDGRYAITGVPCFIKSLRLLATQDKEIKKRIKYTIGIVCGGMESANQAKMIGWELGVKPNNLIGIDFRRKYEDRPASQKIYQVWSNNDTIERFKNAGEIYGTDYGSGFFKPKACDYCDDVVGETADISIGDAWLPKYVNDPNGTSILIVRNKEILALLEKHQKSNEIYLDHISADDVARSQSGGFRHRREGLSMRLKDREEEGKWFPAKRVKPDEFTISPERKKIYKLREIIAEESHMAFLKSLSANDLSIFHKKMDPLVRQYFIANNGHIFKRIMEKITRNLKKLISKKR